MSASAPPAVRVLILEDGEDLLHLIRGQSAYAIAAHTDDPDQAIAHLAPPDTPGLVLVRVAANEAGAYTVARLREAAPITPLVVCSNGEGAIDLSRAGADEWLRSFPPASEVLEMVMRFAREKRELTLAFEREHDMLNALLEVLPVRLYFKDRMSRFLRVSRTCAEAMGFQPDELPGKSDFDIFLADHAQEAFHDERLILRTGEPVTKKREKELFPDGHITWVETSKYPFRDGAGRLMGTLGISWDITEMKRVEVDLEREQNLLRGVVGNVPDSIFVKNAAGVYLLSNHAHFASLGQQSAADVLGKTVYDFFDDEAAHRFSTMDHEILETGIAMIDFEEEAVGADGKHRWLLSTKVPLYNDEGEGILIYIGRDITLRKEAELKLREANTNLVATTAELKNANLELRALQLQVIEAEKHKSVARLAAGVAHEVKNPLAIIMMGAEYLKKVECPDEALPEVVEQIAEAARRADGVVKGLLNFSTPRELELELCDLNEVIQKTTTLIHGECIRTSTEVKLNLGEIPKLSLDSSKIGQVLLNILMNALQAMGAPGRLTITTKAEQVTGVGSNIGTDRAATFLAGERVVTVLVEDTGPGIPESHLGRIFDPFFTTKPTGQGTGLGMTVVKSIIDLHRGTIEIKNGPHGGAAVKLTLKVSL